MRNFLFLLIPAALAAWSCQSSSDKSVDRNRRPEAHSLLGKPLYASLSSEQTMELKRNLEVARTDYEKNPRDPEKIIWLGRRTAYLWHYREAIEIYSKGLEQHPDNAKLYRHRGHRYISIREFDKAITDFKKAVKLTQDIEDEIEPDGQPNELNKPRSTLKNNIWYHLGLAYYLKGEFEKALAAYIECMKYSTWNDDVLCATSDWLYMTYRRLGRTSEARNVLASIEEGMDIIENHAYHKRLLMYKGALSAKDLLGDEGEDLDLATQGYGVGNWYLYNGDLDEAKDIFEKVVEGSSWPAFGYIAAEAELARMRTSQK